MPDETTGIDLNIQHLDVQAAGSRPVAKRLLQASVDRRDPMAPHAAAHRQTDLAAASLYAKAADAGFGASAWILYLHHSDTGCCAHHSYRDACSSCRWGDFSAAQAALIPIT